MSQAELGFKLAAVKKIAHGINNEILDAETHIQANQIKAPQILGTVMILKQVSQQLDQIIKAFEKEMGKTNE